MEERRVTASLLLDIARATRDIAEELHEANRLARQSDAWYRLDVLATIGGQLRNGPVEFQELYEAALSSLIKKREPLGVFAINDDVYELITKAFPEVSEDLFDDMYDEEPIATHHDVSVNDKRETPDE